MDGIPTLFGSLCDSGALDSCVFSFNLNSDSDGELLLGGIDDDAYSGDINYIPLKQESYWEIELDDMQVEGESMTNCTTAIVDSGVGVCVCVFVCVWVGV